METHGKGTLAPKALASLVGTTISKAPTGYAIIVGPFADLNLSWLS